MKNKIKRCCVVLAGLTVMATPMHATENDISNVPYEFKQLQHNFSSDNNTKEYIVIHDTAGKAKGADANAVYNYFNLDETNASSNYVVDDSKILQIVKDDYQSWHCGDGGDTTLIRNSNSIGIEMCVNTDGDFSMTFENTIKLTEYLMKKYNIPANHVVMHNDASGKECSEKLIANDSKLWKEFKESIGGSYDDYYTEVNKGGSIANISNASLRAEPGIASYQIGTIPSGEYVEIMSKHINGWYKVDYKNTIGYVYQDFIKVGGDLISEVGVESGENSTAKATIKYKEVVLRNEPSVQSSMSTTIKKGGELKITKEDGKWVKVKSGKSNGWVLKSQVNLAETNTVNNSVVLAKYPSINAKGIKNIDKGTPIKIIKTNGLWSEVSCENVKGWIPVYYIK